MSTQPDPVLQAYHDVFGSKEQLFYHYTSVQSAFHILNIPNSHDQVEDLTPCLRLTVIEDLSDPTEGNCVSDEEIDTWCPNLKLLEGRARSLYCPLDTMKKDFVLSLCDSELNHSLWRLYANEGMGVCIGLHLPAESTFRVSYPKSWQKDLESLNLKLNGIQFEGAERDNDGRYSVIGLRRRLKLGQKIQLYEHEQEARFLMQNLIPLQSYIDRNTEKQFLKLNCTIASYGKDLSQDTPTVFEVTFGPRVSKHTQEKFTGFSTQMPDISFYALNNKFEKNPVRLGDIEASIMELKQKRQNP